MNFQHRFLEASSDLRARAAQLTTAAVVRARTGVAIKRVDMLKGSAATLSGAGRALHKVARRHASRFVAENAAIAVAAGKDVGALARTTFAALSGRKVVAAKSARKSRATRSRAPARAV
jgi:hypothetical protein